MRGHRDDGRRAPATTKRRFYFGMSVKHTMTILRQKAMGCHFASRRCPYAFGIID